MSGRCRPRSPAGAHDRQRTRRHCSKSAKSLCASAASSRSTASRSNRRRPDPRPDRTERRRQDHPVQLRQPALHAQSAATSCSRAGRCSACRRIASPRSASAAPSRTSRCSAPQSVLDNVRIGGHAHSRSDFVSDTLRLPWVRRAGAALDRDRLVAARSARSRRRGARARGPAARHPQAGRTGPRARRRSRSCCCSTSRPAASITRRSANSGALIRRIRDERRSPCCWSSIT